MCASLCLEGCLSPFRMRAGARVRSRSKICRPSLPVAACEGTAEHLIQRLEPKDFVSRVLSLSSCCLQLFLLPPLIFLCVPRAFHLTSLLLIVFLVPSFLVLSSIQDLSPSFLLSRRRQATLTFEEGAGKERPSHTRTSSFSCCISLLAFLQVPDGDPIRKCTLPQHHVIPSRTTRLTIQQ